MLMIQITQENNFLKIIPSKALLARTVENTDCISAEG